MNTEESQEKETINHIRRVQVLLGDIQTAIRERAIHHDVSKLEPPERVVFAQFPQVPAFGTNEYEERLHGELDRVLQHHYKNNRHHPEHHANGIDDMTLIDLIEVLCDWKAATERHEDGNMELSLEVGRKRFKISRQLGNILENTVREFGW